MQIATDESVERYRGLVEPVLPFRRTLHPYGFAVCVASNCEAALRVLEGMWEHFEPRFANEPIQINIEAVEDGTQELPLAPVFTLRDGLMMNISDAVNMSVGDLRRGITHILLSPGAVRSPLWMRYFLVGSAPLCHIAGRYALPVHAGCVAWNGHGILLCGESGEGKSTLSFACARAGWTYVTDDATYFAHGRKDGSIAIGNCHQIRFRPSAAALFPEIEGREITPRVAGKPSIEIPTSSLPDIACSPEASIQNIVFLSRSGHLAPGLVRYDIDAVREFLRRSMFGVPEVMLQHEATMEQLLAGVQSWELRYTDMDWAVGRLQRLALEGE